jgi:cytidyltransferase-like protein
MSFSSFIYSLVNKSVPAIKRCAELGDKVIIGVTGDSDATGYKRQPIISQEQRVEIIAALREVDVVLCPCPLVVTEEFMSDYGIDLVVHGFANDADAERQNDFFEPPMRLGKFKRIPYYHQLSTTDIIEKIKDVKFD